MRQADQLRAELAQKAKDADAQAAQGKQGVREAIDRIRQSEEILNQTLDAEAKAHQTAARSALTARDEIQPDAERDHAPDRRSPPSSRTA
jgi:phage-related minor tail protein